MQRINTLKDTKTNNAFYQTPMFLEQKIPLSWVCKIYSSFRQYDNKNDCYFFVCGLSDNDFIVRGIIETINKNFYKTLIFDTELKLFDYNHPKNETSENAKKLQLNLF